METIGSIQNAKALGKSAEGLRAHAQLAADLGHLGADVVKDSFKGSLKGSILSIRGYAQRCNARSSPRACALQPLLELKVFSEEKGPTSQ